MRVAIVVSILMIFIINTTDARHCLGKNYVKKINKQIKNICNIDTYNKTNNTDLFNCFNVNTTINCKHLSNFDEYNNIRIICIDEYNSSLGMGVLIGFIMILSLSLCTMK